jgi:hypothetical protein
MRPSISAIALLVLTGTVAPEGARAQPADFAFRLQVGCGGPDILDTFSGMFTRTWHTDPPQSVTIAVTLSPADMSTIADWSG